MRHKKLLIASVLSMITASCYAGSIVVGSEQQTWWAQSNKVQWILALPLPSS